MAFGKPKVPKPPKLETDAQAAERERQRRLAAKGRESTILGGRFGLGVGTETDKSLLGQ